MIKFKILASQLNPNLGSLIMALNFNELLSKPVDSVERPPTKPAGTYHGIISKYEFGESLKQKTPYVRFTFNNITPGDDITPEHLKNPKTGEPIDLTKWTPRKDFFLTDDSLFRLREFLESLGIPTAGRSFSETIPEARGQPVTLSAINTTSDDGSETYTNIGTVMGQHG